MALQQATRLISVTHLQWYIFFPPKYSQSCGEHCPSASLPHALWVADNSSSFVSVQLWQKSCSLSKTIRCFYPALFPLISVSDLFVPPTHVLLCCSDCTEQFWVQETVCPPPHRWTKQTNKTIQNVPFLNFYKCFSTTCRRNKKVKTFHRSGNKYYNNWMWILCWWHSEFS